MLNHLWNYEMTSECGVLLFENVFFSIGKLPNSIAIVTWMSHLLTELALNVLGPRGMVDGGHGVQALATEADGVAHLLLVDALKEPV